MSIPNAIFGTETGSSATVLVSGAGTALTNAEQWKSAAMAPRNDHFRRRLGHQHDGTRVALNAPGQSSTASLTVSGGTTLTTSTITPA